MTSFQLTDNMTTLQCKRASVTRKKQTNVKALGVLIKLPQRIQTYCHNQHFLTYKHSPVVAAVLSRAQLCISQQNSIDKKSFTFLYCAFVCIVRCHIEIITSMISVLQCCLYLESTHSSNDRQNFNNARQKSGFEKTTGSVASRPKILQNCWQCGVEDGQIAATQHVDAGALKKNRCAISPG